MPFYLTTKSNMRFCEVCYRPPVRHSYVVIVPFETTCTVKNETPHGGDGPLIDHSLSKL